MHFLRQRCTCKCNINACQLKILTLFNKRFDVNEKATLLETTLLFHTKLREIIINLMEHLQPIRITMLPCAFPPSRLLLKRACLCRRPVAGVGTTAETMVINIYIYGLKIINVIFDIAESFPHTS